MENVFKMFIINVIIAHYKISELNTIKEKLKIIYYLPPKDNQCYHFGTFPFIPYSMQIYVF